MTVQIEAFSCPLQGKAGSEDPRVASRKACIIINNICTALYTVLSPNQDPQLSEKRPSINFIFVLVCSDNHFRFLKELLLRERWSSSWHTENQKKRTELKTIVGLDWYYRVAAQRARR